jgi:hypothetical protein
LSATLVAQVTPRRSTDGEFRDAREKYLQTNDVFVDSRESSESAEMVFIA